MRKKLPVRQRPVSYRRTRTRRRARSRAALHIITYFYKAAGQGRAFRRHSIGYCDWMLICRVPSVTRGRDGGNYYCGELFSAGDARLSGDAGTF